MSDGLSVRLPDLPNAGYASKRQKETTDAIMFFLRGLERDRPLLLQIVIDGDAKWLKVAARTWRGLLIDRELLLNVFNYMRQMAGPQPEMQLATLEHIQQTAERLRWDKRTRIYRQLDAQHKATIQAMEQDEWIRRALKRKYVH